MRYLASIRPVSGSLENSASLERSVPGEKVGEEACAIRTSTVRVERDELKVLAVTCGRNHAEYAHRVRWSKLTKEFLNVHSISLQELEAGIRIGGDTSGGRTFRVEKSRHSSGGSARSMYQIVESSPWITRMRVALFGSKSDERITLSELCVRMAGTNQLHSRLESVATGCDELGEPQGFNGIDDQKKAGIVAAEALAATEELPEAKLPLSFNVGNSPYGIFANKRKEAIRNAILKDVYPQFAKEEIVSDGRRVPLPSDDV